MLFEHLETHQRKYLLRIGSKRSSLNQCASIEKPGCSSSKPLWASELYFPIRPVISANENKRGQIGQPRVVNKPHGFVGARSQCTQN